MGSEGVDGAREDPRVSSVLERLSQLEGRVGGQLDQLVHLQQQQVMALPLLELCLFMHGLTPPPPPPQVTFLDC